MFTEPVYAICATIVACTVIRSAVDLVRCWVGWRIELLAYREPAAKRCSAHYEE
jgi:hypothetical protein